MSLIRSDSCFGSYGSPMGSQEQPKKFRNQDFEMLREYHLKTGACFTDEYFPANMNSIGLRLKQEFDIKKLEWKRPTEIIKDPQFTVDGISQFDIMQSGLGDCWVLSAFGCVTLKPRLLEKIIPLNQEFSNHYAGIFHFRLWHLGEWVDIVIDDRLPFLDGKYLSVKPSCQNEFWPCLLEKAYAKFLGSYQNLHWGNPSEALENLTGGLTMTFDLKSPNAHSYWNMISLASRDTIMACISHKQDPSSRNENTRMTSCVGNQSTSALRNTVCRDRAMRNAMRNNHPKPQRMEDFPEDLYMENGQTSCVGNQSTSALRNTVCRDRAMRNAMRNNQPKPQRMEDFPEDLYMENGQRIRSDGRRISQTPPDRRWLSKSPNRHTYPHRAHMENNPDDFRNHNVTENRRQLHMDNPSEDLNALDVPDNGPRAYSDKQMKNMLSEKLAENALQDNGLVTDHAYSITDFAEVFFRGGTEQLIRVWNPWGFGEWNGNWSDRCPFWKELSMEDRLRLQKIDENGEFWMSWKDFTHEFSRLIICNQVPDFYDWGDQHKKWYKNKFRGQWTKENLSWNHEDKDFFNKNPLYSITVTGSNQVKSGKNVVVSLMQASRNRYKYGDWLPIGFVMFELDDSQDKFPSSLLTPEKISTIKSSKIRNFIEAFNLSPGRYGVIPYTTQKDQESSFLLQVFLKGEDCTDGCNY